MTRIEHLFTCLAEECAEVIKEVSKCQRFGPGDQHPMLTETNLQRLNEELCHILAVVQMLVEEDIGVQTPIASIDKMIRVEDYILYAKERGTVC